MLSHTLAAQLIVVTHGHCAYTCSGSRSVFPPKNRPDPNYTKRLHTAAYMIYGKAWLYAFL